MLVAAIVFLIIGIVIGMQCQKRRDKSLSAIQLEASKSERIETEEGPGSRRNSPRKGNESGFALNVPGHLLTFEANKYADDAITSNRVDPKWEDDLNHPDNCTARAFSARKRASIDFKGDPASYRASHRE